MQSFNAADGGKIVFDLIKIIQENKQHLSDIDGLIGDGDHGINMNKGFTMCQTELEKQSGDLSYNLKVLSRVLIMNIGGSMGPLYGKFFRAMSKACADKTQIDARVFGDMLQAARYGIGEVSTATVGDKTMLDTLIPALEAYTVATESNESFSTALDNMTAAALAGRDSTTEMAAKVGRASRLGERSKGVPDPGASSCYLILSTMAGSTKTLLA